MTGQTEAKFRSVSNLCSEPAWSRGSVKRNRTARRNLISAVLEVSIAGLFAAFKPPVPVGGQGHSHADAEGRSERQLAFDFLQRLQELRQTWNVLRNVDGECERLALL